MMERYDENDEDDLFDVAEDRPPENLEIELIHAYSEWDTMEKYQSRAQDVKKDVESFVKEHDVYNIDFNSIPTQSGTLYEVWIFYEGEEG